MVSGGRSSTGSAVGGTSHDRRRFKELTRSALSAGGGLQLAVADIGVVGR